MVKTWIRAWLGVDAIEAQIVAHQKHTLEKAVSFRADVNRDLTAIAQSLIAAKPTTTQTVAVTTEYFDPTLGRL